MSVIIVTYFYFAIYTQVRGCICALSRARASPRAPIREIAPRKHYRPYPFRWAAVRDICWTCATPSESRRTVAGFRVIEVHPSLRRTLPPTNWRPIWPCGMPSAPHLTSLQCRGSGPAASNFHKSEYRG